MTMTSVENGEFNNLLPTTKDILGDHLYRKVNVLLDTMMSLNSFKMCGTFTKNHLTGKLTGMLMESTESDIKLMLQEEDILSKTVHQALHVLNDHLAGTAVEASHGDDTTREELGEGLYKKVLELDKDNAPKITGMLLELEPDTILSLLEEDQGAQLAKAVAEAQCVLRLAAPT